EISSWIIRKLRHDAQQYLGSTINEAVITVPAYFSEQQRRATVEAGRLAGLRIRRVLNEPTAAALAYASRQNANRIIVVYDLGGGTFDVTCLRQDGRDFRVLSTTGDSQLGGMDFTRLLLDEVRAAFEQRSGLSLTNPVIQQQLYEMVERGKIELSSRDAAEIGFPFIGSDGVPLHLHHRMDRAGFNRLINALVEKSFTLTFEALHEAKLKANDIDSLVLSGGSSRIPMIRQLLQQRLGCSQVSQVNPDEIVALGAAIQASMLTMERDMSLRDVTAFDLGVEIDQGRFVALVQRNSPLPAVAERVFTTISDDQSAVEIHVQQGTDRAADKNTSLGRFLLSGIRRGQQGTPRIRVRFKVDVDGLVTVSAYDQDTGARQRVTLASETPDAAFSARDQRVSLRSGVQALVQRLEGGCKEFSHELDSDFLREAREACAMARRAVLQQDTEAILRIKTALETLLIEVQAAGGITNE
ncbi:MAG: heat-shock protein Hsp70, partial [Spirochaetaceae bacterium]